VKNIHNPFARCVEEDKKTFENVTGGESSVVKVKSSDIFLLFNANWGLIVISTVWVEAFYSMLNSVRSHF
jgi:hypothetical protein